MDVRISKNQARALRLFRSNPELTQRELVEELSLGGMGSASYIINTLESKGYIERKGNRTSKTYNLTTEGYNLLEDYHPDPRVKPHLSDKRKPTTTDMQSTDSSKIEKYQYYFESGLTDTPNSTSEDQDMPELQTFFSASFRRILKSGEYDELVVVLGTTIVGLVSISLVSRGDYLIAVLFLPFVITAWLIHHIINK